MTLDRLWAGWRASYLDAMGGGEPSGAGPAGGESGCLFCGLADGAPDEAGVVARDERVFTVLNRYPYTSGHVMVVPTVHEAQLDALSADDASALMAMMQQASAAVRKAYAPDGVNVGMNLGKAAGAGVPGHLHVHLVPRWTGDTNFMTSIAEARVLPEPLATSLERLRAAWPA